MATLADIRLKVRRLTGLSSGNQITNAEINSYINDFYQYDLPERLRLQNLKELYEFTTQPNIDQYAFTPNTNVTIEGPVYIGGYQVQLFQDRAAFLTSYPKIQFDELLDTGTGIAGPYSGTITAAPVLRNGRVLLSTVDNTGNALSALDDGNGSFTGDVVAGATINYITGAIANLTWSAVIVASEEIRVQSINYQSARPWALLFFNDRFELWPVPDQAYRVTMNTYVTPTALVNDTDEPVLREWWQLLGYGATLKIFADRLDTENYQKVKVFFDEQLRFAERRTLKQLSLNRASTIFSDDFRMPTPFNSNIG